VRARRGPAALVALAAFCLPPAAARAEPVALVGATLHPVSGPSIPGGTLVVENGKIAALGAGLAPPAGARVVDLTGKHVYPGFVHPLTTLGLVEIDSVRGTVDTTEVGDLNAALRAEVAFNADSLLLMPAISGGVLAAHVAARGGVVGGSSAVMSLAGWNWQDMTLRAPAGLHVHFPTVVRRGGANAPSEEEFNKTKEKALKTLTDIFANAQAYRRARQAAAGSGPPVDLDPNYEALVPLLDGKLRLFLHASEKNQIEHALDWAKKEGLVDLVLVSGADAAYLGARLARDRVPVILDGVLDLPARRWEPYDAVYAAAARLHEAGVRVAIGDGRDASMARNLPFHAAMAAAFGLPPAEALRSVTLTPAELTGVAARLGSLEVGKDATLFAADGDPLEIRTRIERVWIAGHEVDLRQDRQWQLYQRYLNRPRPQAAE
jgi:imidazolonepropionase-like amidohydrolase